MLRLTLEYDGTDFAGWQSQPGMRTVEGVVRAALQTVTGETPPTSAASRTDAGAHSVHQVMGVNLHRSWDTDSLRAALNAKLPQDVTVAEICVADDNFHARHNATSRRYRYVVAPGSRNPLLRRYAWQVKGALDVAAMHRASRTLLGTHDFASFGKSPNPGGHTVRSVNDVSVRATSVSGMAAEQVRCVVVEVEANAFLYGMMRSIVGALVAVGKGKLSVAEFAALLDAPSGSRPHVTVAPARGLHQWMVSYS